MRKTVLLFALLVVVLTGCRLESNMVFDINEDGSAIVGLEIGIDDEFKDLIESQAGGSVDDMLGEMFGEIDGTEDPVRVEGDMTYYRTSIEVADLATWDWESFGGDGSFSEFSYEHTPTSAKFKASIASVDTGDVGGDFGFDPSTITGDIISANLIVSMPGEVTTSNADEVRSDGTLVWNIPLGGSVTAMAESSAGSSGSFWIWVIIGLVLLAAIVAGVIAIMMGRKGERTTVEKAAAAHQAGLAATPSSTTETLEMDTDADGSEEE